ncbi:MAG TPA: L-threonylcarbamoyladenylate synthase [Polyangiales bacterium]|jgi:tRNA threonylcarbamoyl adenosine modification protein (Sua5/YciO/YrdC/YwlC family)|nr:L-threonylcarbamoyladenylate synthase [Polyangiales bacterium]
MRIEIHPTHPQPRRIRQAVEILRRGGVIVYPTGTVYGLGCDIHQKKAVERIYQIRHLKKDHPLSFMCPDLSNIARYAHVDDFAYRIMKRLVPGPYTFVLRATREVPKLLVRKQKTVGIRVPDDPVALALLHELGSPIVSTSATFDGEALNDPDELHARFHHVDAFVDAGWGGIEPSTIIDLTGDEAVVLREGAGPVDVI